MKKCEHNFTSIYFFEKIFICVDLFISLIGRIGFDDQILISLGIRCNIIPIHLIGKRFSLVILLHLDSLSDSFVHGWNRTPIANGANTVLAHAGDTISRIYEQQRPRGRVDPSPVVSRLRH